jgi:hypothetical protein
VPGPEPLIKPDLASVQVVRPAVRRQLVCFAISPKRPSSMRLAYRPMRAPKYGEAERYTSERYFL